MSGTKIAREAAETEVQGWCERFGVTPGPASLESITSALMAGRLTLDEAREEFTIRLRSPIRLENGEVIEELTIGEPDARQLRDANKSKDEFDQTLRLLAAVSGRPLGVLERLKQKDLILVGEVFGFFG